MVDQGKPEEGEEETRHARLGCADDASKVAHEENRIIPKTLRTTPSDHTCHRLLVLINCFRNNLMTARPLRRAVDAIPEVAQPKTRRRPSFMCALLGAALSLLRRAPHDNDKGRETW
jgi:hypothetical protein